MGVWCWQFTLCPDVLQAYVSCLFEERLPSSHTVTWCSCVLHLQKGAVNHLRFTHTHTVEVYQTLGMGPDLHNTAHPDITNIKACVCLVCVFCFKLLLLSVHLWLTVCQFVHACARVCCCWCELTIPAGSTCASCSELMDWATHMLILDLKGEETRRDGTRRKEEERGSPPLVKVSVILHWCRGWNTSNRPQRFRLSATILHLRLTVQFCFLQTFNKYSLF